MGFRVNHEMMKEVKESSTVKREFIQNTGIVLEKMS